MTGVALGLSAEECRKRQAYHADLGAYLSASSERRWHHGRARGYRALAEVAETGVLTPLTADILRTSRPYATPSCSTFDAWARQARSRGRRDADGAYASGIFSVWLVHPDAVPCANCDLPVVPTIEDHALCGDHGLLCSAECRAEMCRTPECRDPEEYR